MGGNSTLFSFIFRTMKTSANDPKSKSFLPVLLSNIKSGGSLLLPLKEDSWTVGRLGGANGLDIAQGIADNYSIYTEDPAIPFHDDPYPFLELKDNKGVNKIIINGLENVYVTDYANYNYDEASATITADINMQFNYWTNNPGKLQPAQKITPLSLSVPFILTQKLCLNESTGKDATAPPVLIVGEGTFTADITQLNFNASIKAEIAPNRSGLNLAITKLALVTTGPQAPKFKNVVAQLSSESNLQKSISRAITEFMKDPEASEAVFTQMQNSLNDNENIKGLSNAMNTQLAGFLDARLGAVTSSLPGDEGQQATNKVDLYLFDRIRYSLNNPNSSWYVKTLLQNYKNPPLNPFRPQDLNLGEFEIPLLKTMLTNATLSNIVITGFPNATVPAERMILAPPSLQLRLLLGSLQAGTTASADFSASYASGKLKFGITVTLSSIPLSTVITPTGDDASELVVTFNAVNFQIPEVSNMVITIADGSPFARAVEKAFKTPAIQQKIAAAINSQLTNHLTAISSEVTKLIRALLNQQLGGN